MNNIFGIKYDLRQDLYFNDVFKPLKTLCLLRIIPKLFTPELLFKYGLGIYPQVAESKCKTENIEYRKKFSFVESMVYENAKGYIRIPINKDIARVTHFIGSQIFNFLSKNRYSYIIICHMLMNLVFNYQGTINLKKTVLKVLDIKNIPDTEKFEIACQNFIGEDVILKYFWALSLPSRTQYLHENPIVNENIPKYFWVCRFLGATKKIDFTDLQSVTGDSGQIYFESTNSQSSIKYIFYWAFCTFNDMAVQYLWEEFISNRRQRDKILAVILTKFFNDIRMTNSVIYLLSNITDREIAIPFQLPSETIFRFLLLELRWQCLFSKVLEVLHVRLGERMYIVIFRFMISILCSDSKEKFDRCLLKDFLIKMPIRVRIKILNNHRYFLCYNIIELYRRGDLESCSFLTTIVGPLDTNNVFITSPGITMIDLLFICNKSIIIDLILRNSIYSPIVIRNFKMEFYRRRAHTICQYLIIYRYWSSLDGFINWCLTFIPAEFIKVMKIYILVGEDGKFLKKLIFHNREAEGNFEYVDRVLKWCFSSQNDIIKYKNSIIMVKETETHEMASGSFKVNIYKEIRDCFSNFQTLFLIRLFEWKPCFSEEVNEIMKCLHYDNEFHQDVFREGGC